MIDIPIGKALVPVDTGENKCKGCCFYNDCSFGEDLACVVHERKDGKNVIFKLVDYKEGTRLENGGAVS